MVRGTGMLDAPARLQRPPGVVPGLRLDADHPDARVQALGRGGAAGDQPAAADRHQQRAQLADLLEQFERGGALSRR